jgi:hypothetical protein
VHHRRRTSNGLVDKIEAISAKGEVIQAEIHVYDVGRLPHGDNGMDEAHRYYRVVQSERPNLMLPKGAQPTGPKTVSTPPNYTPAPNDQRIMTRLLRRKKPRRNWKPPPHRFKTGSKRTIICLESCKRRSTKTSVCRIRSTLDSIRRNTRNLHRKLTHRKRRNLPLIHWCSGVKKSRIDNSSRG